MKNREIKRKKLKWRIHTPNILKEILNNPGIGIFKIPISVLIELLYLVAKRASILNDPELNSLMARLTLYDVSDPLSKGYNKKTSDKLIYYEKIK